MNNITNEINKCLSCKNPFCQKGCPINNPIRDMICLMKQERYEEASKLIYSNSPLPYICSVVCPHENNCVGNCILNRKDNPVNVGLIEKTLVNNYKIKRKIEKKIDKSVAIIGSGPGGLASAILLAMVGFNVTIYERENYIGGILSYGIPNYRSNKDMLDRIISDLNDLNITVVLNKTILEEDILALKEENDYLIISTGLTNSRRLGLIESSRVIDANKILKDYNYHYKYNEELKNKISGDIIVIGAGNVSMDVSRVLKREGNNVKIVYRRSILEAPATKEEINSAYSDGVEFNFLENPVSVVEENGRLKVKVEIMELGEPDISGRRSPQKTGKYREYICDYLVEAIGQMPNESVKFKHFDLDKGYYKVNDHFETNICNIYAIGDITLGAKTVVEAINSAKICAKDIFNKENI